MIKTKKNFNYMHVIATSLIVASLLCSVFLYPGAFIRIKESFIDIWNSLRFYIYSLISSDYLPEVSVNNTSSIPSSFVFPLDWEMFKLTLSRFWVAFWDSSNFNNYLVEMSDFLLVFSLIFQLGLFVFLVLKLVIDSLIERVNNDYNVDTKPLKIYKRVESFFYPAKKWLKSFFDFFINGKIKYSLMFILIWMYNVNIFSIIIEFLAFLFYFVASLDFSNLYIQFYKLFFDIWLMFSSLPFICWLVVFCYLINKFRIKKGYDRLNHLQAMNCGFVKSLSTCSLIAAEMNAGKTKFMTSMTLTTTTVFKETAKETLYKCNFKFPDFPWIVFERKLIDLYNSHDIYSLASCERYVKRLKRHYELSLRYYNKVSACSDPKKILFGYDVEKYPFNYNNGMYLESIFDVLKEYSKAFFVYAFPNSFAITNYAVREDNFIETCGNFPLWNFDFFSRNPEELDELSYYSKILDFDILRPGKKVIENNPFSNSFEFGNVTITELDKERGNSQDTKELKKNNEQANQKNDLFNYSLKMGRHPSTIDFKPYVKFYFDMQREMKVDADLREVCGEILTIESSEVDNLTVPFFFLEEFIYGFFIPKFKDTYELYRFFHGNNTLIGYLLKKLFVPFYNYYNRMYNIFGFDVLKLDVTNGRQDAEHYKKEYYILRKKDFAKRYCTDSHSDFYRESALSSKTGLIDYPAYSSEKASLEELERQNSYFIKDLMNIKNIDKE